MARHSGAEAKEGSRREVLLAGVSLLVSLLLSLALAEVALRVGHSVYKWHVLHALPPVDARALIPSKDPELIYEWNPGWRSETFAVNSFGMPNDETTLEKPPGVFRIAFVGDSISANFERRPRPEIYLNVLAGNLNQEKRPGWRFEALNFGVTGYGILQELRMLRARVLRFHPDLVVIQQCLNDPYPSDTPYAQLAPIGSSRLWNFVFHRLEPDRFWAWFFVERYYDQGGLENLGRGTAGLAEVRQGVPVFAVLFPYLYAPAYDRWAYQRYHALYREGAERAGIAFLDLYPIFRQRGVVGNRPYPIDPIHPEREGHALAAAEIERRLDELGLLPARQDPGSEGVIHWQRRARREIRTAAARWSSPSTAGLQNTSRSVSVTGRRAAP
jgi:lysophospholipase L1-like esterase